MTSILFHHPVSGEHLGSTCICGLYTVGGGEELCYTCRPQNEVAQLKAEVAQLKAEISQLRHENVSLVDKMETANRNSLLVFKAMMSEMSSAIHERDNLKHSIQKQ